MTVQISRNFGGRKVLFIVPDSITLSLLEARLPFQESAWDPPFDVRFEIRSTENYHALYQNGELILTNPRATVLVDQLERQLQLDIGSHAPEAVFVHAGVVVWKGRAIVLPGPSHHGKSTFTDALVKQGATYFSDEFAVVGHDGLIYPYRRALTLRQASGPPRRVIHRVKPDQISLCRIGMVVDCRYKPGARWNPKEISLGEGVLSLFSNTVSARLTPQRDLRYLAKAMQGVRAYRTLRGDAVLAAKKLLCFMNH